jgi:hypothetical protein
MLDNPSIIKQASHGLNHHAEDNPDGNSQTTLTRDSAYEVHFSHTYGPAQLIRTSRASTSPSAAPSGRENRTGYNTAQIGWSR